MSNVKPTLLAAPELGEGGSGVEWVDDIFGYDKLVAAEKATLQKGNELPCRQRLFRFLDVVAARMRFTQTRSMK